ncbi:hypothetical protein NPIL_533381 [Nephila pilipes]|uniref:Uncharacterized protein n=1 Tax=Nephila pilipes TaxID=299642 RepID=A0A8X6IC96_NEPPI|nr:hypothetical protein NPIL_533381 [Nephila pilipes]
MKIPRKEYITLEYLTDDDGQNEKDIIIAPPEMAEASIEEEGNYNVLNNYYNDILPNKTVGKVKVHVKWFPLFQNAEERGFISLRYRIEKYNTKIGGVDLCDNLVSNYRIRVRGKNGGGNIY